MVAEKWNARRELHFLAENGRLLQAYLAFIERSVFFGRNAPKKY